MNNDNRGKKGPFIQLPGIYSLYIIPIAMVIMWLNAMYPPGSNQSVLELNYLTQGNRIDSFYLGYISRKGYLIEGYHQLPAIPYKIFELNDNESVNETVFDSMSQNINLLKVDSSFGIKVVFKNRSKLKHYIKAINTCLINKQKRFLIFGDTLYLIGSEPQFIKTNKDSLKYEPLPYL